MSSEVETSLILIRFLKRREIELLLSRFARHCPGGFAVHVARPLRSIRRLLTASPEMLTNEFSGAALASLRAARLGFPAENAKAAGKHHHTLR